MRDELAANVRKLRGPITQRQLADSAGLSVDTIRKIEQAADDYNPTLAVLVKLARGLDIPVPRLFKNPSGIPTGTGNPNEGVMAIREALSPVDELLDAPAIDDTDALSLHQAQRTADYVWSSYWSGRYDYLTSILPTAITQLRATVHTVPLDQRARAHELLARICWCTGCSLVHLGQTDAAWQAIRLALDAANEGSDPLLSATLRGSISWQLLVQGRYEESRRLSVATAESIEPQRNATLPELSAFGSLVITAATAAGRDQRVGEAQHLVGQARTVANRMGVDRQDYETYFGPSQVAMQAVDVAVVTEDFTSALDLAKAMPRDAGLPLASRCRHLTDKSVALTRVGRHREALDALLAAEQMGPEWIKHQTLPKRTVADLLERDSASQLRQFARRIGVPG